MKTSSLFAICALLILVAILGTMVLWPGLRRNASRAGNSGTSPVPPTPSATKQDAANLPPVPKAKMRPGAFVVEPYLQRGDHPSDPTQLTLCWISPQNPYVEARKLQVRVPGKSEAWREISPQFTTLSLRDAKPMTIYRATLTDLAPGEWFDYQLFAHVTTPVFAARARAPRAPADTRQRFAVFADCAAGTTGQKRVAGQIYNTKPDFVFVAGDLVYDRGRFSEYSAKWFPIYNSDKLPLMRETLMMASVGNHDHYAPNLSRTPDGMAYYYLWDLPMNGPDNAKNGNVTQVREASETWSRATAGRYPRMANYSFDVGRAHWTVLDANPDVDWRDEGLRAWLEADLQKAQGAAWRFVAFHQPPFNSSKYHAGEDQMRVISDLLERGNVTLVFSGHVHNYQRTHPLTFAPDANPKSGGVPVPGAFAFDRTFDGKMNTTPRGVIYIITGAGGGGLYNPQQQFRPQTWQPFTAKYIADDYSFTLVDIESDTKLTVRQIDARGRERDRFVISH